ncbi:hypothetical protein QJS66_09505 [Kocuria rhizophila]|nr:hypothetical protein QJS66_09505 [Kocuria rhizophila]
MTWTRASPAGAREHRVDDHTPVPAGIDRFPARPGGAFSARGPGLDVPWTTCWTSRGDLPRRLASSTCPARHGPAPPAERANGVAQLHGAVSRSMSRDAGWPPCDEVPISSATNGVHVPAPEAGGATLEPGRTTRHRGPLAEKTHDVPDTELWAARRAPAPAPAEARRERLARPGRRRVPRTPSWGLDRCRACWTWTCSPSASPAGSPRTSG